MAQKVWALGQRTFSPIRLQYDQLKNASFPVDADVISFGKEPGTRTEWHVTMWRAKYITVTENERHSHKEILFITGNIV